MTESEFAELAAGHALGALSPEDERTYLEALRAHPEWQDEADRAAEAVAFLADAVPPVTPPAALRASVLASIGMPQAEDDPVEASAGDASPVDASPVDASPVQPVTTDERASGADSSRRGPSRRGWFALAASLVAILVLAGTAVFVAPLLNPAPPAVQALERIEDAPDAQSATVEVAGGGEATAHWSASLGEAVLVTDGVTPTTADETFELWFVRDGEAISGGLFAADDTGDATALLTGAYESGDVIAVTVEPSGGSPTGAPTSDPIVTITT